MKVVIDVPGAILYLLLNLQPLDDDEAEVIGLSRVAYLSAKDPAHVLLPAARWHDAAYKKGASIQQEWSRHAVDSRFLRMMLDIAGDDYACTCDAVALYLAVRKFGERVWEGAVPTGLP